MTTLRLSASVTRKRRRPWAGSRTLRRLSSDPQTLLAVGVVATTMAVAAMGRGGLDARRLVAISIEFLAAQAIASVAAPFLRPTARQRAMISFGRFALAILYVTVATALLRSGEFRPVAALYIPIVALAAAQGTLQALLVGSAAIALYLVPVVSASPDNLSIDAQRAIALGGTAILLSIGTRRSISALTETVRRLGASLARDRRRSRQLAAVESVGRLLASTGPAPETLERIVGLLQDDLGYDFVSVYFGSATRLRIAVQAGYDTVIEEFDGSSGVVGRVMRSRELAFVPDVGADTDYRSAAGAVRAEISAPLLIGDDLVGVVNVEARGTADLDASDVETMRLVAERMASALALAGERERLAARAELFRRLTSFATAVNATLDPDRVQQAIVDELADLMGADTVGLTVLDRPTGGYVMRAVAGRQQEYLGLPIQPGIGLAGRAIRDRALVIDPRFDPTANPEAIAAGAPTEPSAGVGVPLVRDDVVVGALALVRHDLERPFTPDQLEALPIVAGVVALAITNTFLHAEVIELSVRDALTGLFNRRYLDATMARLEAIRTRRAPEARDRAAVAIFDLDHFGEINKRHGHQAGDAILRAFADVLRARFRGTDVVARYGGEEFLAILDGATLEQAQAVAEEIRTSFARVRVDGPDGSPISATVSAGCAAMTMGEERFEEIVTRADVGLVLAKRSGRNRVVAA
ncbi:MAG TPA: sensor domain-containing diguanylate cyclase [Verrucomicrobiae bacterium]|jgi:diguanylate cyclase (GGDEF)-like protein|nr:sensor domain-containing diguanylate cyclase [Verrucomicrobiae bacterium]